ncbi:MAG: hypothetical protein H0T74_12605 [Rubrobacteraceae bacterium]|nr:hypothetical protein [Rubrobacteraceae bacterium]
MLIELWRKTVATSYSITSCAICGNDFDLGTVYPVVAGDQGQELGEMCPTCLDYLNSRKADAENSTSGNWPAREWPAREDLEEARRRFPSAIFETDADHFAAAVDQDAEDRIYRQSVIWSMAPETIS